MDGLNQAAFLSQLGRIKRESAVYGKDQEYGLYHPTNYGYICPYETPDGDGTAKTVNLTLGCLVSQNTPLPQGIEFLLDSGAEPFNIENPNKIFLNGDWVGSITQHS